MEAAGEVFAELGYRAATVRQICEKAGANIAAVNYYFGDKEGLYLAVLRSVPDAHAARYPAPLGLSREAPPEQQLRAYIQSLLHRVFDSGRPGWHTRLIARELAEPTPALDTLVEDIARPLHRDLATIVRRFLGPKASDEVVRWSTLSIMGQCVYYHHARTVLRRLYPDQGYAPPDIMRLTDHIVKFSIAALRKVSRSRQAKKYAQREP